MTIFIINNWFIQLIHQYHLIQYLKIITIINYNIYYKNIVKIIVDYGYYIYSIIISLQYFNILEIIIKINYNIHDWKLI